jgi:hypothetical protein
MKNTFLTTLFVFLFVTQVQGQSWLKVDWGSTRKEVHYAETGQLVRWDLAGTHYQEKIDERKYARSYRFIDNNLVSATQYPELNPENVNSDNLMDKIHQLKKLKKQNIEEMGEPDFVDNNKELSVKHFGWNLDSTFAITQVNKEDGDGNIWYSKDQLSGNKRKKRYQNEKDALRAKFRKLTGKDEYLSLEEEPDLPQNLKDNPSLNAEDKLVSRHDEMEGQTIYRDPSTGTNKSDDELALVIIEKENDIQLVLSKSYSASDWLFISSMTVLTDGERYKFENISDQVSRETTSIGIKETYLSYVQGELVKAVRAIANAKKAKIRLSGENSYRDIEISEREKRAMRNILALYDKKRSK